METQNFMHYLLQFQGIKETTLQHLATDWPGIILQFLDKLNFRTQSDVLWLLTCVSYTILYYTVYIKGPCKLGEWSYAELFDL